MILRGGSLHIHILQVSIGICKLNTRNVAGGAICSIRAIKEIGQDGDSACPILCMERMSILDVA
ncbi:hypothetical protein DESC_300081 [Desulfosarcina cetonica]|nr:hypothetical protein DESC_300081 [Desulfosarcina cetonica]